MKALLLVAHGSRLQRSNDEVLTIIEKLKSRCKSDYQIMNAAFLELAKPSIPEGIKMCVDKGADSIIILPYFLNSGRHVLEDIPEIVKICVQEYSGLKVKIAEHAGASEIMVDLLLAAAEDAVGK